MIKAAENYGEFPDFYAYVADDINKRAHYVISELAKIGISCSKREGTYYILIDVSPLALCLEERYYTTFDGNQEDCFLDRAIMRKLALEHQVGLFPLSMFFLGDGPRNYVRASINRRNEDNYILIEAFRLLVSQKDVI